MGMTVEQYLRPDLIRQVRRLDLKARFIVEGFLSGLHNSPNHGFSVEFSEHRKYAPGDDLRQIDWNVYAKTDRFYTKKFQAETNLDAYLLVDASASMDFATGQRMTKMDYAICLAAAMGYMMIHQQDAVALAVLGETLREFLPPRSKRSHLVNILGTLARTRPQGTTHLAAVLHELAERIRRRGLVILLSDLLDEPAAVIEALHHLRYRGHDLIIFQIFDHSERVLPYEGPTRFEDPESGEQIQADPRAIRATYIEAIEQFIATYRRECQGIRADFVALDNAMTFDKALVQFLVQRQGRF
jgi:uncharacterized protein (DUF58 family)